MSKITEKDLDRVDEPCKSCFIEAYGRGKQKAFYCKELKARLMGNPDNFTFSQLPDCPKRVRSLK